MSKQSTGSVVPIRRAEEEMKRVAQMLAENNCLNDRPTLGAMQTALRATIRFVSAELYHKDPSVGFITNALGELSVALEMASEGEKHPALMVKKTPSQRRGYNAAQRKFLEACLRASEVLVAMGNTRSAADATVTKWAAMNAKRLGLSLGREKALTHIRKRLDQPTRRRLRQIEVEHQYL